MSDPGAIPGFAEAGFVPPDYAGRHLGRVLPAVAAALGVPRSDEDSRSRELLRLPRAQRAVVVLIDGLGRLNLEERAGHAPFLRSLLDDTAPAMTAGFPSTTAASMGTFGTGTSPGRTGLVGYTARNPRSGRLANLVQWDGAYEAAQWQREPTLFEHVQAAGVPVTSIGPMKFAGSGLTEAALRGARYRRAERIEDRVDACVDELMGPALVYLYWGDVDKIGHQHGWRSWQWGDALTAVDRELARLERMLPPGTTLVVTSDHGMVDVDRSKRWDVAATPALADGVALVGGEPRAVHLYLVDPATASSVAARWRGVLGEAAVVATRDEAIAAGWFGIVADHVLDMLGDVVVAATGRATIVDSRTSTPHALELVGVHGSMTAREMYLPFLTVHR